MYLDSLDVEERTGRATSQLASATAIVSGLAPRERWAALADRIADPRHLVDRTWFANPDGFDEAAVAAASLAHPLPDWDVESQIAPAKCFAKYQQLERSSAQRGDHGVRGFRWF